MSKKQGRGRPALLNAKQARHVASLVRNHTGVGAVAILAATDGELAELRNKNLFPEPISLSLPTVTKAARANGVELKRGRPTLSDAEKADAKAAREAEAEKRSVVAKKAAATRKSKKAAAEPVAEPVVEAPVEVAAEIVAEPIVEAAPIAEPVAA
jgi:transposase